MYIYQRLLIFILFIFNIATSQETVYATTAANGTLAKQTFSHCQELIKAVNFGSM